jgi:xanthosine utilization system XapX-like protein
MEWADIAEPLIAGLGGMLGVYLAEDVLRVLRAHRLCPARWSSER